MAERKKIVQTNQAEIAAVQKANLIDTLSRRRPLTLFAPTNEAFAKLPPGKLEELLNDVPYLTKLLKYHMVHVESRYTKFEELIEKKTIKFNVIEA